MAREPHPETESLRRSVESLTGELLAVYEELALLHSLGPKIGRLTDQDQIAAEALREAVEAVRADCGWVVLWEGEQSRVPAGCRVEIGQETAGHINHAVLEPLHFRNKAQVLSHAFQQECLLSQADAPVRFLACSLPVGRASLGYLCLGRRREGQIFTSVDQKLINAVASLTAVELENIRLQRSELEKARLENELELARSVQRSLLPRDFAAADFLDAEGTSLPCYKVGGDYFDLLPIGTDLCLMVVADVSGKGPAAALQAAMLQGVVHALARRLVELPDLMGTINECIRKRSVEGSFATAFLATLDRTGRLRYSNGGHNPPLWIKNDGTVVQLTQGGPLLGLLEDAAYQQGSIAVAPGDLLVLYTDGVTEAENANGETFGVLRMLDWARRQAGQSPADVQNSLIAAVGRFCGGRLQADDLTLLTVRFRGAARPGSER